jgi:hypothetical protein
MSATVTIDNLVQRINGTSQRRGRVDGNIAKSTWLAKQKKSQDLGVDPRLDSARRMRFRFQRNSETTGPDNI